MRYASLTFLPRRTCSSILTFASDSSSLIATNYSTRRCLNSTTVKLKSIYSI